MASTAASSNQAAAAGWMTLRVPPHVSGTFYGMEASVSGLGGRIVHPPTSRTLGRNYNSNNNSNIVMPNPDDILPKEAWTDFSGTGESTPSV